MLKYLPYASDNSVKFKSNVAKTWKGISRKSRLNHAFVLSFLAQNAYLEWMNSVSLTNHMQKAEKYFIIRSSLHS